MQRSLEGWNIDIYGTMQGPNEFLYTGNLKDWNRIPDMHRITAPALIRSGPVPPVCRRAMLAANPHPCAGLSSPNSVQRRRAIADRRPSEGRRAMERLLAETRAFLERQMAGSMEYAEA